MREELQRRIAAFVRGDRAETFEGLALALHRWQAAHDPVQASLIEGAVSEWTDIPAVPVGLFRQLPVGTVTADEPHRCFLTSGTTTGNRGAHRLRDTELYDLNALTHARRAVPELPMPVVALLEDPAAAPSSSLSHMVSLFGPCRWLLGPEGLGPVDVDGPSFVATTAFALYEWLERAPAPLPSGCILMVTGGFKGRVHHLDHDEIYTRARQTLRPARLVTEYGMCELSSQLWGEPGAPFSPPPWLRVYAVDPGTDRRTSRGQLRFVDLCNLDSAVSIETLDEGIVHDDGRLTLLGRLEGAVARGCSLTVEEAWRKR